MRKAFTLIELLVVIAIIGLIASIVLVNLQGTRGRGRVAAGKQFASSLEHSLGIEAVGIWRLNEGSGLTAFDNSGYGNNGTLINGPVWQTEAQCGLGLGSCLQFDGAANLSVSDPPSGVLDFGTGDFTISSWIQTSTNADNRNLIHKGAGAGLSGWRFGLSGGKPHVLIGDTVGPTEGLVGSSSIADNNWHFVAVVYNRSGNAVGYVDGVSTGTTLDISTRTGSVDNSSPVLIRANTYAAFSGYLDDVAIYASALTTAQVQQLYAEGISRHLAEQ
jgi:prepilin-type N-terminal cleavage/methylation domain-containing protein